MQTRSSGDWLVLVSGGLLVLAGIAGCATTGARPSEVEPDGAHPPSETVISLENLFDAQPDVVPEDLRDFTVLRTFEGVGGAVASSTQFDMRVPDSGDVFLGMVCSEGAAYEVRLLDATGEAVTFFGGSACPRSGGEVVGYTWPVAVGSEFTAVEVDVPTDIAFALTILEVSG